MYLHRKHYYGGKWKEEDMHNSPHDLDLSGDFIEKHGVKLSRVNEITEEVMYWRKANQIHKWFVDNVQNGVDDCKEYYVTREDLEKLLKSVDTVLENHDVAEEVLPVEKGFFFGGDEYDDWYFEDLVNTQKGLKELLAENECEDTCLCDYSYNASW